MTAWPSSGQINITFHGVGESPRLLDAGEDSVWLSSEHFEAVLDDGRVAAWRPDQLRRRQRLGLSRGACPRCGAAAYARRSSSSPAGSAGPDFLSAEDVRSLVTAGMTIGCHGMRHRSWRRLDDRDLREELRSAPPAGRDRWQPGDPRRVPVRCLRSPRAGRAARHGYERVFTSDGGDARSGRWLQPRNTIRKCDSGRRLERRSVRRRARLGSASRGVRRGWSSDGGDHWARPPLGRSRPRS